MKARPSYFIGKACRHWTPELNRRFRVYRFDVDRPNFEGQYAGAVWDAKKGEWLPKMLRYGDISRPAEESEIPDHNLFGGRA